MQQRPIPRAVIMALAGVIFAAPAAADPVADFYRGKTVNLTVGTGAGGGYDTYARVIARHMSRYIPGEPTIVVKNNPGAGGLVVANTTFNIAARDGTEIATFNRTIPLDPLLGNTQAQFDPLKYTWIGSPASEVSTCVSWHESGVKTVADLRQQELVIGGTGTTTDSVIYPRLSNILLGTKFKIVTGYPGGAAAILAMERGETKGWCGWAYSSMEAQRPGWLKEGKIHVLLQYGMAPNPMFPGAPLAIDLARTSKERQMLELIVAPQLFARPYMAPPGVPADRTAALQRAFEATMKDPQFAAEARERRLDIELVKGSEILAVLQRAYATPKDLVEEVKALLK